MSLRLTRWSPDTCGCVVDYEWDDALSENDRTHTVKNIVKLCPAHAGKSVAEMHTILFDENPRKNRMHSLTKGLYPTLFPTVKVEGKDQEDDSAYLWSYDSNRILNVTIAGLKIQDKKALQSEADKAFGVGKVKVK